jgi:mTERF domain-containing protein
LTPSRSGEICKELEALGLPITHPHFAIAFTAMSSLKRENWQRKVALYQQFRISKSELLEALKKHPMTMKLSFENIKEKFWFFMDELKLQPSDVMERPILISYSLEKSILPRCAVLSLLMTEGKIDREIDLY